MQECIRVFSCQDFNQKLADHLHLVESFHFLTLLILGCAHKLRVCQMTVLCIRFAFPVFMQFAVPSPEFPVLRLLKIFIGRCLQLWIQASFLVMAFHSEGAGAKDKAGTRERSSQNFVRTCSIILLLFDVSRIFVKSICCREPAPLLSQPDLRSRLLSLVWWAL